MKSICLVTHKIKRGDGQGRVNYEIVRAARACGYQVTVLASECAEEVAQDAGVEWVKIPVDPWISQLLRNQIFAWRSARWLRHHGDQFDLIHANGFITWYPANINSAHFVHGAWLHSPYSGSALTGGFKSMYQKSFSLLNAMLEKRAFRQADTVVSVSPLVVDELRSIGVPSHKIVMIPNGVDTDEYHPGCGLRSELNIAAEIPLAIFSGDLRSRRKNLETVLAALQEAPDWHLLVLGRTEGSTYPALADALGLSRRVHFLGFRRDTAELMRTADVLVFPSRYDPCTLVVAEALSSGVPVITAQSVGAAFQVPDGGGWVLDDPEDGKGIALILRNLAAYDKKQRDDIRARARAAALEYTWSETTKAYLELYERSINSPSRSGAIDVHG
ncbi:MAG: glycosyltransferase family 4 protein [Acidithiobacillus sp.]|nr:glycosyltransferase family 4 protein [Acidithiobacillus sp.]